MRTTLLVLVTACGASHVTPQPLPPLIVAPPPRAAIGAPRIIPGEHMIWQVAADGVPIGRAEMITDDHEIESHFATDGFASMFADVHEDLTTPIVQTSSVYSLHSAIAWLRGWSPRDATPAALDVEYDGDRYHVVCEPPLPGDLHGRRVLRVACRFDSREPVALTLQLGDDSERAPLRVVARIGSVHLEAELISRELRGARATPVAEAHASLP